jgi:BioD-like phosphotransacetylase family protein
VKLRVILFLFPSHTSFGGTVIGKHVLRLLTPQGQSIPLESAINQINKF